MRRHASTLLSGVVLVAGCTCGRSSPVPGPGASASATASAAALSPVDAGALSVFSAPIAAARAGGHDVVAGLVASEGVIRVAALSQGHAIWTADALRDVAWSPDAELHLQATPSGFALVWRGPRAGRAGRTLVLLGAHGETAGAPGDVGAAMCITDQGIAWVESRTAGPSRVMGRAWSEPAPRLLSSVSADRDPALVCGDHDVIVLGDGDDDLTSTTPSFGDAPARPAVVVIRDADFGDDDEREHDAYSVGDDLGIVRVASGGGLALREVPRGGSPGSWRRLSHAIPGDDDVVAVDGDASATFIVYTEDASSACPGIGSAAASVHAIRVGRKSGDESLLDLAPPDCARAPGPFWIAATPSGSTVGWVERRTGAPAGTAPIAGASFRLLTSGGVQPTRVDQAADALVDAGCDARGCALAALLRPADADGMKPEAIGVFSYP